MPRDDKDYIIEYIQLGDSVKVTAADPISLAEASIVGDIRAGRDNLARLAVQKLEYVLAKRKAAPKE